MQTPIRLANTFIERYGNTNPLTHMKLQKLIFLAYGWNFTNDGQALTPEQPQMWRYGPVFESLYRTLTGQKNHPITKPVMINPFTKEIPIVPANPESQTSRLVDWIWSHYGHHTANDLSEITHARGTPWHTIAVRNKFIVRPHQPMVPATIADYFDTLAKSLPVNDPPPRQTETR